MVKVAPIKLYSVFCIHFAIADTQTRHCQMSKILHLLGWMKKVLLCVCFCRIYLAVSNNCCIFAINTNSCIAEIFYVNSKSTKT